MLHVRDQVLFCFREFRRNSNSLLLRHDRLSQLRQKLYVSSSGGPAAPARSCDLIFSTLNLPARSRMVLNTSSSVGGSPLIQRRGLIRAMTNERRYGLTRPRSLSFFTTCATFSSRSRIIPAHFW